MFGLQVAASPWLTRNAFSRFLVLTASGTAFGIYQAVQNSSFVTGLVAGLAFGATYGATMAVRTADRLAQLRPLTLAERRLVVRAVADGTAPDDPRLAAAVLARAARVRESHLPLHTRTRPIVVLSLFAGGLVVTALVTRQPLVLAFEGISLALWQDAVTPGNQWKRERELMAAEFAARRARQVLGRPDEAPPPVAPTEFREPVAWLGALAAVALILGVSALNDIVDAHAHRGGPPSAQQLAADGYHDYGAFAGTRVWMHIDEARELAVQTTGSIVESCRFPLASTAVSPYISRTQDVCRLSHSEHGSMHAYIADSTMRVATIGLSNGAVMHSSTSIDLDAILPGERAILAFVPSGVETRDVSFG